MESERVDPATPAVQSAQCPHCGSDQIRKTLLGGSAAGGIVCVIVAAVIVIPGVVIAQQIDLCSVTFASLLLLVAFVSRIAPRYKCGQCRKGFDSDAAIDLPAKGELSRWALWSFMLSWVPLLGLLLAILAVRKTRQQKGIVYGQTLAWIALVISGLANIYVFFVE